MCPCRLPDHLGSLAYSSTPTGQPQRKPAGQMCHACSEVLPAVVDWRIVDLAVIRRWRLVDWHPSGTGELVRADRCTSWCRACTWLSLARQASVARCAGAGTTGQASVKLPRTADHTHCSFHHSLHVVGRHFRWARQKGNHLSVVSPQHCFVHSAHADILTPTTLVVQIEQ